MSASEAERVVIPLGHVVCHDCRFEDILSVFEARDAADDHRAITGHDVEAQEVSRE